MMRNKRAIEKNKMATTTKKHEMRVKREATTTKTTTAT
jgi:hypothetical protein